MNIRKGSGIGVHILDSSVYPKSRACETKASLRQRGRILTPSCSTDMKWTIRANQKITTRASLGKAKYRLSTRVAAAASEIQSMNLKTYKASELWGRNIEEVIARPRIDFESIQSTVRPILEDVRTQGNSAVKEYTEKFDKCSLDDPIVLAEDLEWPELPKDLKEAFDVAYDNISTFHSCQQQAELRVETMPGVFCRRISRPIGAVGLYVPGGTAILPSSALMLSIPAKVAGCETIVLATPPRPDGSISPEVTYCAKKVGVTHILKAGGAQAVAAMAYGTQTCPKVDKILGPGNQYVTAAKMILQNSEAMIGIDMPAGPSEVLVIADKGASPAHIAADLLSQAEHGPDSQVVLVVTNDVDLDSIQAEVKRQCDLLPRSDMAVSALSHSFCVVADSLEEACKFSNLYAPEHLIVNVEDAEQSVDMIENAGSIFLGRWTPESVGDYASGTNHVLPTYGYAKMYSGVSLDTFQKKITVQQLTEQGLKSLGPYVEKMAAVEGLDAHKQAVTLRLESLE